MNNSKIISLGDNKIFEFVSLKTGWTKEVYTKFDTKDSSVGYPVYTAAESPVAHVEVENDKLILVNESDQIFSFASNGDGSAGRNFVIHKSSFYISNDRTVIKIKDSTIDIGYVLFSIRNMKEDYGFDFSYKAIPANVSLVTLNIPLDSTGGYNLLEQKKVAEKYNRITDFIQNAEFFINELDECSVSLKEFMSGCNTIEVSLSYSNSFLSSIGDRLLKKDQLTQGIEVYSANVNKPFGYVKETKLDNFEMPSLIWGIDGVFDWAYIPENKVFEITDHCGRLQIINNKISPKYVYYFLKSTKDQYGFDRTFRASLTNLKENVIIELPIDVNGEYDYQKQVEISEKYERIFSFKNMIVRNLSETIEDNIQID
ncbi:TPA: hypothetical protein G8V85_001281 [Salmonella enterica]|nr:hypothetical protein [Salmonella enterica subsp. enterica serovar Richmond]HAG1995431.1 hypothetical protein [Salmonella enterica]